jgi:hypothetical protein
VEKVWIYTHEQDPEVTLEELAAYLAEQNADLSNRLVETSSILVEREGRVTTLEAELQTKRFTIVSLEEQLTAAQVGSWQGQACWCQRSAGTASSRCLFLSNWLQQVSAFELQVSVGQHVQARAGQGYRQAPGCDIACMSACRKLMFHVHTVV